MCKHVTITHTYTSTFCTKRFFLALWGSIVVGGMIWSGSSLLSDSDSVFTTHDILKTDAPVLVLWTRSTRGLQEPNGHGRFHRQIDQIEKTAAEGLDKGRGRTWSVAAWLAAWKSLSGI